MNTKLITIAIASLISSAAFAGECPGRAGVCQSYDTVISMPNNYQGNPVAQLQGRGAPQLNQAGSGNSSHRVVDGRALNKYGRA